MNAREQLDAHGVEATPRRMAVIEGLAALPHAPTAPELLEEVRQTVHLDKVTLYRTLDLLVETGIIGRHPGGDGLLRYCLVHEDTRPFHAHFYCTRCRRMSCLPATSTAPPRPEGLAEGMTPERVEVRFDGICSHCGGTPASESESTPDSRRRAHTMNTNEAPQP